jgi:hypothetical protein
MNFKDPSQTSLSHFPEPAVHYRWTIIPEDEHRKKNGAASGRLSIKVNGVFRTAFSFDIRIHHAMSEFRVEHACRAESAVRFLEVCCHGEKLVFLILSRLQHDTK